MKLLNMFVYQIHVLDPTYLFHLKLYQKGFKGIAFQNYKVSILFFLGGGHGGRVQIKNLRSSLISVSLNLLPVCLVDRAWEISVGHLPLRFE